jgi:hypothetical protein
MRVMGRWKGLWGGWRGLRGNERKEGKGSIARALLL